MPKQRMSYTKDLLFIGDDQENVIYETSQQLHHKKIRLHCKENTFTILLVVAAASFTIVNLIVFRFVSLVVLQKTNLTQTRVSKDAPQSCGVHFIDMTTLQAPCCNKDNRSHSHLLDVLMIARLTSDEKENNTMLESSNSNTNGDGSLFHQEAYLDPRHLFNNKEHLSWIARNFTNISNGRYSRSVRFLIPKKDIYYIYVSLAFHCMNTTEILSTVYRERQNNDEKLLFLNKTVQTTGNENGWSYYDMKMSGLFRLYKGDELYMKTSNTGCILPYIVCNYFAIVNIPTSVVSR